MIVGDGDPEDVVEYAVQRFSSSTELNPKQRKLIVKR